MTFQGSPDPIPCLASAAEGISINPQVKLQTYYRSALNLLQQAVQYHLEGDLHRAFVLYHRFATLIISKLPSHPQYNNPETLNQRNRCRKKCHEVLHEAENLKKSIRNEWQNDVQREKLQWEKEQERIAVEAETKATAILEAKTAPKLNCETTDANEANANDSKEKSALLPITIPIAENELPPGKPPNSSLVPEPSAPSLVELPPVDYEALFRKPDSKYTPPSVLEDTYKRGQLSLGPPSPGLITSGLRSVFIPESLVPKFLDLALENSSNNIETCGMIGGIMASNTFTVTTVVIPKQIGTSDSCTTRNEEEVFEVFDKECLLSLGWIHTHPRQTCFMSSVDLHTHCTYQMMMEEAVAIVCSVKYSENNTFSLTSPYGVQFVGACTKSGFHPHPENPPLYEASSHIKFSDTASIKFIDLR